MTNRNIKIDNPSLSWKSKGIYNYLSGRGRKTDFSIDQLVAESRDNRVAVYSGIAELKKHNYLYSFPYRRKAVESYIYIIFHENTVLTQGQKHAIGELLFTGSLKTGKQTYQYSSNSIYKKIYKIIFSIKSLNSRKYFTPRNQAELDELIEYWQINVKGHKKTSKAFLLGKERLENKYTSLNKKIVRIKSRKNRGEKESPGFKIILSSMQAYSGLVRRKGKKWPWYFGLDEFFAFNDYTRKLLKEMRGGDAIVKDVASWFLECKEGAEYCFEKYGGDRYPVLSQKIAARYGVKNENDPQLIKATSLYHDFFIKHKGRYDLPNKLDEDYPLRFLKYLFKFLDKKFVNRKFKPYIMTSDGFLDVEFKEYLEDMGWLRKR